MEELNAAYKKENLRALRRTFRFTQKEFITRFLSDDEGNPMISVATLSNLEAKDGPRMNEVISTLSENLDIDPLLFSLPTEEFLDKIRILLSDDLEKEMSGQINNSKKGNINQLVSRVTMYIADQLFEGNIKKGDKIESDRELAAKLCVGRSALREALKVLDVLGMIDIRPGQGTYISDKETNFFIIPLAWSLFLNGNQIENIIQVRNLLEVKATYLAASRKNKECLDRLYDICHRIHNAYIAQDYKAFLNADLEFHICIAEGSENQVIYSMIQTISNLMKRVSGTGMVDKDQLRQIYDEHQKIYGLILASDAEGASKAMEEHLEKSVARYNYR